MVAGASLAFPPVSLPLSIPLPLSPHNNPTAVLMVTLSAKSKGLDFLRTHELSTEPEVDTLLPLSLCFPSAPSWFFLSPLNVSFIPPRWPRIPLSPLSISTSLQLICHRCLLSQRSLLFHLLVFVSSSRNANHDWALLVCVYEYYSNLIACIC